MQGQGARRCLLGLGIGFLTLILYFAYMPNKLLIFDNIFSVEPVIAEETAQRSHLKLPPVPEPVWRRFLANSSELNSNPESLRKPLQNLKEHVVTELVGKTYQTLVEHYIEGKPLALRSRPDPAQIVIVTTWRSGSTFTEQLFDSHPAIMDAYEPLSYLDLRRARNSSAQEAVSIVRDLLQCRYTNAQYLQNMKKIPGLIDSEIRKFCKGPPNVCFDPRFLSQACQLFPWILIKTVRLPLALMEPLLENPVSSNLQIIYLVRDPRAVINSRRSTVKWCTPSNKECYLPSVLCDDMEQDLKAYLKFKDLYPGHIHLLRYEDMMNDVMNQSRALVESVGLNFTESIEKFVLSHTTKDINKAWTTSRVSKERLLHWTSKLSADDLESVQSACAQTMVKFGYKTTRTVKNLGLDDVLTNMDVGK